MSSHSGKIGTGKVVNRSMQTAPWIPLFLEPKRTGNMLVGYVKPNLVRC